MAKQRDDRDLPRKKKEEPSDVVPLDELEVVEELDELEEVEAEELEVVEEAAPDEAAPAESEDAKKTRLAKKGTVPTMLAPQEELEQAAADDPKKTKLARKSPVPTMLAPEDELPPSTPTALPNLSLDKREEEVLEVVEAVPGSDVIASEFADKGGDDVEVLGSDVLEVLDSDSGARVGPESPPPARPKAATARPDSDVARRPDKGAPSSDVLMAEPVGDGARGGKPGATPTSDVIDVVAVEPASGVVEMRSDVLGEDEKKRQPTSSDAIGMEEVQLASGIVELAPDERDLASDIFTAEDAALVKKKPQEGSDILAAAPKTDADDLASDIFSAETLALEAEDAKKKDEDVLDEVETVGIGSSAIQWDDVQPASDVGKTQKTALETESTRGHALSDVESPADLGAKQAEEDIDEAVLEALEDADEAVAQKGAAVKKGADEAEDLFDAHTELDVSALEAVEELEEGVKKAKSAEEEAEDLLLAEAGDDEAEVAAAEETEETAGKAGKRDARTALMEDEGEMEAPRPAKKKKKRGGEDDEEEGGVATMTKKSGGAKSWLGGAALGVLLAAGGVGGAWYMGMLPDSPNAKAKTPDPAAYAPRAEVDRVRGDLANAEKERDDAKAKRDEAEEALKKAAAAIGGVKSDLEGKLKKAGADLDAERAKVLGVYKAMVAEELLAKDAPFDVAAFEKAVAGLGEASREYPAINKALALAKVKGSGSKGLAELINLKDSLDRDIADIDALIKGDKLEEPKSKVVGAVQDLLKKRDELKTERDALDSVVLSAYDILAKAKIVDPKSDPRKALVKAVEEARLRGESPLSAPLMSLAAGVSGLPGGIDRLVAKSVDTVSLASEVAYFRLREPLVTGPEKNVDLHIVLLQDRARSRPEDLDTAMREAAWLLSKEAKASPELRGKAHYVLGLAARNEEKFPDAVKHLAQALALAKDGKGSGLWAELARLSFVELTDPHAYYLPRSDRLAGEGKAKDARLAVETGLKAMPGNAHLILARGLLALEEARADGRVAPEEVVGIRVDANAAAKHPETRPMGVYLLGLIEEEQRNASKAEASFREALKIIDERADERSLAQRILILTALSRVLQLDRYLEEPAPEPKKVDDKKADDKKADDKKADDKKADDKKADDKKDDEKTGASLDARHGAMLMLMVGAAHLGDDDDDPEARARLMESIKLAEELIASDNPRIKGQGYILKGKAVSKLGDRNEGLRLYVKGIMLANPGKAGEELVKLVEDHPAISYPDSASKPNRYTAEDHFGRALQSYWVGDHAEAEKAFRQAVYWFKDDARYHYFLGLSLWGQRGDKKEGKKKQSDAIYAFQMGSRLEARNLPPAAEVNASLERIQGELRQMLNNQRLSAVTAPPEEEKK